MNQRELDNNIFVKIIGTLLALPLGIAVAVVNIAGTIIVLPFLAIAALFRK